MGSLKEQSDIWRYIRVCFLAESLMRGSSQKPKNDRLRFYKGYVPKLIQYTAAFSSMFSDRGSIFSSGSQQEGKWAYFSKMLNCRINTPGK